MNNQGMPISEQKRLTKKYLQEKEWLSRPDRELKAKDMIRSGAPISVVIKETGLNELWVEAQARKIRGGGRL